MVQFAESVRNVSGIATVVSMVGRTSAHKAQQIFCYVINYS